MADAALKDDRPFRRSLYVMLVVIGLIASGAFFYARDARQDAAGAQKERDDLKGQLAKVIDGQATLLERQKQSDAFIARVLAGSSDPVVAGALEELGIQTIPSYDRRTTTKPTPTRSSQPRPRPRPTPTPTTIPAPLPSPVPRPSVPPLLPLPLPTLQLCPPICT